MNNKFLGYSIKNNCMHVYVFGVHLKFNYFKLKTRLFNDTKIKQNKIVFVNFIKNGYGDNPKYIAEKIIKQKLPYEMVWLVKNPILERKNFPKEIKLVRATSLRALKEFASAKIWVSNVRLNYFIKKGLYKKNGQLYIQTWHGALGIKKIEKDIEHNPDYTEYVKIAKQDSGMEDYLISPSGFDTEILKNSFWFNKEILNIGYPRNDLFFADENFKKKIKNKVRRYFKIDNTKKIVLYTPTFRESKKTDMYDLDFEKIKNELEKKYNEKFLVLIKFHPHLRKKSKEFTKKYKNVLDATNYSDIQELLLTADVLITDYSSSIFDFMLEKKTAFIYANDIAEYTKERGFYLDITKTPFPIAYDNEEFLENIKNFNNESYLLNLEKFIENRKCFDNGLAGKNCVEIIKQYIKEDFNVLKNQYVYDYLKKYSYILNSKSEDGLIDSKSEFRIWQMWWQGEENAPEIVKKCLESVEKYYPNNRVVITSKNLSEYLEIPPIILEKFEKGLIEYAHFSDFIRTALIYKYGGVWIDSTCFLTEPIPNEILEQEVFYFKKPAWEEIKVAPDNYLLKQIIAKYPNDYPIHSGSNWFLVGKQNNVVFEKMYKILLEYWNNENFAIDYFFYHTLLSIIVIHDKYCNNLYNKMLNYSNNPPHLLQKSLDNDFDEEIFNSFKNGSFVHKLRFKKLDKAIKNEKSFLNYILKI